MAKPEPKEAPAADAPSYTGPEIVSKLSAAKVVGNFPKPTEPTALFSIFGIASNYKTGKSDFGDWLAFTGTFEAVRKSDGKSFVSSKVFLPNSIQGLLLDAMKADKETGEIPETQFAIEIGVKPAKNVVGYEYSVTSLIKPAGVDPLAALRDQLGDRLRLNAPSA